MTKPMRLVAVLRVSQRKGREGDSFLSPVTQRRKIEAWAAGNNATIVEWFDETDSVSGHNVKEKRPGLHLALDEISVGHADGLIVAKIDRFARNLIDGLLTIRELKLADKAFVAAENNINTADKNNQITRILIPFLLLLAEWEWETRRDGWLEARRLAVERGIAYRMPYGYERSGEDAKGAPAIVPERAKVVRLIFKKRLAGASWAAIADLLNEKGYPPPHKAPRWVRQTVKVIAANRAYIGEMRSGDLVNLTAFPPIVDRSVFDKVQAMTLPAAQKGNANLLAGLLRCANCGGRMTSNGTYGAYRCQAKFTWGECDRPAWVAREAIERHVEVALLDGLKGGKTRPKRSDADLAAARQAVDDAQAALDDALTSPVTARLRKKHGQAKVDAYLADYMDELEAAEAKLAKLEEQHHGIALPRNLAAVWAAEKDVQTKRALLAQVYPVIIVRPLAVPKSRVPVEDRVRLCGPADLKKLPKLPGRHGGQGIVRLDGPCSPRISVG